MRYQHIIAGVAWLLLAVAATGIHAEEKSGAGKTRIFIGTYTRGESKGVYTSVLDLKPANYPLRNLLLKRSTRRFWR